MNSFFYNKTQFFITWLIPPKKAPLHLTHSNSLSNSLLEKTAALLNFYHMLRYNNISLTSLKHVKS